MRKLFASVAAVMILASASSSIGRADTAFEQGKTIVSAGVGFGVAGIYGSSSMPALSIGFDRGMSEVFSIGGVLGYSSSKQTYDGYDNYGWKYSYTLLGVRGSYHLNDLVNDSKVDLYVGGMLGYNKVSAQAFAGGQVGDAASASYALYGVHAGGRYFFSPKLAGFAELGYGMGNIAAGVSMKL